MTKSNITQYDNTAANNTDVEDVPLGENQMYPADVNNAFRELMADLADMNDGTVSLTSPSFSAASLTGNLSFGDNNKAIFGAGGDLVIQHNGGDSLINDVGTGSLKIQTNGTAIELNTTGGSPLGHFTNNGDVKLFWQGSEKFATTSTGIDVNGTVTADGGAFTGDVTFGDSDKAIFGAGSDLQIYHNGTDSYIYDGGTGDLNIRGQSKVRLSNAVGANYFQGTNGAEARIYYNGSTKLATTASGIDVTGNTESDTVTIGISSVAGSEKLRVNGTVLTLGGSEATPAIGIGDVNTGVYAPTAGQLGWTVNGTQRLFLDSTGINVTGTVTADGLTTDNVFSFSNVGFNGEIKTYGSGTGIIYDALNGYHTFRENGTAYRMQIRAGGDIYLGYEDTGTTPKLTWDASEEDLKFADNSKAIFGAGSDLQIYSDGSSSFIEDTGPGNLILRGTANVQIEGANGENCAIFNENGSVRLFYDNVEKLETTSTGIDVTGTVTADGLTVDGSSSGRVTLGQFTNTTNAAGTEAALALRNQATGNADVSLVASRLGANFGSDFYIETSDGVDGTNRKRLNVGENGDISFYEDTGTTAKFFWDASAENLGLGTSSPSYDLHIKSINTDQNGVFIQSSGSNNYGIYMKSAFSGTMGTVGALNQSDGARTGASMNFVDFGREIAFNTNAGASNAERLRIDSSGNVGVGTTSPNYPMTIHKTGDGIKFEVSDTVDANYRIQVGGSNIITGPSTSSAYIFQTGNTERMRLNGVNLMVGGTVYNPAFSNTTGVISLRGDVGTIEASRDGGAALELNRKTSDGAIINLRKDGTAVGSIGVDNSNNVVIEGDSSHSGIQFGTGIIFPHKNGALIDAGISLGNSDWRFQNLHLSGTANVGILEVNSGTSNLTATFQSTDTTALIAIKDNTTSSDTHGVGSVGDNLTLYANGSERIRITSGGDLLISTTSNVIANASSSSGTAINAGLIESARAGVVAQFNRQTSDGAVIDIQRSGTTVGSIGSYSGTGLTIASGGELRFFTSTSNEDMRLETDGDLHVDGNVVAYSTTISDIRLKKEIAPIEDAVTKVQQLNGCTFTYLKDDRKSAGLIAQDVEKVLPSAVIEDEAVFHGEEGETYKTVQYDQVIGLLVEAVKELKAEIEELKDASSK
jgi:hypothetical protein